MEGSCPTESASPMEVRVDTEPWLLTEEVPPPPPVAVVAAEAAPILRLGVMETPETKQKNSFYQSNIHCIDFLEILSRKPLDFTKIIRIFPHKNAGR